MKDYFATTTPGKFIRAEISYDIGGTNYFSGTTSRRGYYLIATPVEKSERGESFMAFSGLKCMLVEVKRRGQSGETIARKMAAGDIEKVVYAVLDKNSLALSDAGKQQLERSIKTLKGK